jgi:hypothetical protein
MGSFQKVFKLKEGNWNRTTESLSVNILLEVRYTGSIFHENAFGWFHSLKVESFQKLKVVQSVIYIYIQ